MPYLILRVKSGWLTNNNGDFLIEDTEQKCRMWIPNNLIGFTEGNEPYFSNQKNNNIQTLTVAYINEEFEEDSRKGSCRQIDNHLDGSNNITVEMENTLNEEIIEVTNEECPAEAETGPSNQNNEKRNMWSVSETKALLTAVEGRYEDMHHVHKRKQFWTIIEEELCSQNIQFSADACKKKWFNLVRTYKNTKDIKCKTGRGPVKFLFYDRLDALLGDSPSNASPHSCDVDSDLQRDNEENMQVEDETEKGKSSSSHMTDVENTPKRKNPSMELVKIKKKYLEQKMENTREKEKTRALYVKESICYKQAKLQLDKEKLEMDKKKVEILNNLLEFVTEKTVKL